MIDSISLCQILLVVLCLISLPFLGGELVEMWMLPASTSPSDLDGEG